MGVGGSGDAIGAGGLARNGDLDPPAVEKLSALRPVVEKGHAEARAGEQRCVETTHSTRAHDDEARVGYHDFQTRITSREFGMATKAKSPCRMAA